MSIKHLARDSTILTNDQETAHSHTKQNQLHENIHLPNDTNTLNAMAHEYFYGV